MHVLTERLHTLYGNESRAMHSRAASHWHESGIASFGTAREKALVRPRNLIYKVNDESIPFPFLPM